MSEQLGSRKGLQTKDIVLCGILMALTTVMTMIVQIPVIGAHGYVNMGDTVVLFTALYLGKKEGAIVGGLGSALADLISGYGVYAPVTLIAKGLEGFVCGLIADKVSGRAGRIIGTLVGGTIMVTGYFIGEIFMYGLKTSAAAVPANSMLVYQGPCISLNRLAETKRPIEVIDK